MSTENPDNKPAEQKPEPPPKQLWDQQPDESAKAFEAFTQYLAEPCHTTIREFAEKSGQSIASLNTFSSRHHWRARATAWRHHIAAVQCAEVERKTRETANLRAVRDSVTYEQQWELGQLLYEVAQQKALKILNEPNADESLQSLALFVSAMRRFSPAESHAPMPDAREKARKDFRSDGEILFANPLPGEIPGIAFANYVYPGPDAAKPAPAPPPETPIAIPTNPPPAPFVPEPPKPPDFSNLAPGCLFRTKPPGPVM
jgi:hypothetical protein